MGTPEVRKTDQVGKPAVRKPVATPAPKANGGQSALFCNTPNGAAYCAFTSYSANLSGFSIHTKVNPVDQRLTQDALNSVSGWTADMIKKATPFVKKAQKTSGETLDTAYTQAKGILSQISKDIDSIPSFKPNTTGMSFDTGLNLSSTPGANGEFTLENPLTKPETKPAQTVKLVVPVGKHLTPAQKAQAEKERQETARQEWTDGKISGFAQKYWTAKYPQLAHRIEKIESFAGLSKVISDYENPAVKPLSVKLGPKAADDFYRAHGAQVEAAIQAHPEIQDKNSFRNLIYATFTQESSFRPHTVTLLPHVQDRITQKVTSWSKKQTEYAKAEADQKTLPGEIAKFQAVFDGKRDAFLKACPAGKRPIDFTSQKSIDGALSALRSKVSVFTRDEGKYKLRPEQQAEIDAFQKDSKAKGAKPDPKRIKRINLLIAKQRQYSEFAKQIPMLTAQRDSLQALSASYKRVTTLQALLQSAPKRKADNTLSEQDKHKALVLGGIFNKSQARVNSKTSFAKALTEVAQDELPKKYARAEANGLLELHITGNAKERLQSIRQLQGLTDEQKAALEKSSQHVQNSEGLLQLNRQSLQYQIQTLVQKSGLKEDEYNTLLSLKQKSNRTVEENSALNTLKQKSKLNEDENNRLDALQEREDINIINEYLPAAKGVGQLMDVEGYNRRDTSLKTVKLINPFDAEQNIIGAVNQLAELAERARGKGITGVDQIRYVACGYNGGQGRADDHCIKLSDRHYIFKSDSELTSLPLETQTHIRQVSKYANAYSAIFSDAQRRRTDYVDKLIKAKNDTDDFANRTFKGYIELGQQLDATHKPAPVEKDLRADTWAYWKKRIFGQ